MTTTARPPPVQLRAPPSAGPAGTPTRRRSWPDEVAVAAVAVGCGLVVLASTRHVLGFNPDSVAYLSSGVSLAHGRGLTPSSGGQLTVFGPGYPAAIAVMVRLGLQAKDAARAVNAGSLAATVMLSFLLLRRHVRSRAIGLCGVAAVALSALLFEMAVMVWSESLFIALLLAFLLVLESSVRRGSSAGLAAVAGALASLCFLVRYTGIVLVPVGALALLALVPSRGWRQPVRALAAFGATALVLPVAWMARNYSIDKTLMGARYPASATLGPTLHDLADWLGRWLLPIPYFNPHPSIRFSPLVLQAVGTAVTAAVLGALGWQLVMLWRRRHLVVPQAVPSTLTLLTFVVVYLAYLVVAELTTGIVPIADRLVAPVAVPLVVLAAAGCERLLQCRFAHSPVLRVGVAVAFAVLLVNQFSVWRSNATNLDENPTLSYGLPAWQDAPLASIAEAVPATFPLYSDVAQGLWLDVHRTFVYSSPVRTGYRSSEVLPVASWWVHKVDCHTSYLAWFTSGEPSLYYSPAQLARYVAVRRVASSADGTLYRLSARRGEAASCG